MIEKMVSGLKRIYIRLFAQKKDTELKMIRPNGETKSIRTSKFRSKFK
jgi:hypothetical protein